jgi:hypothetical protein
MLSLTDTADLKNKDYDRDSYDINKAAQDIAKQGNNQ